MADNAKPISAGDFKPVTAGDRGNLDNEKKFQRHR